MAVDVVTSIDIARPRDRVAEFVMNPTNATDWYRNIASVDVQSDGPFGVGSRMAFQARFLGQSLAYTYEVVEYEPGRRLVMRTADGPFPMETDYSFEDTADGGTRVTLRNRGEPAGFSRVAAILMEPAMRSANRKDLRLLKEILEAR
ncbi:SRPBCC family protein [Nocardia concava]|uniref:SRPBCC family protein n=1 Tax=Nocardia concava TaxID=257281 RepID=UPI0002EAD9DD|nr:SRPBCC family protein [Nocardia concava]